MAHLGGEDAECDGQVRLANTRRAEQDEIAAVGKEACSRELIDDAAIDRRLGIEVEAFESLDVWQSRELQIETDGMLMACIDLGLEQVAEEVTVRPLFGRGALTCGVELVVGNSQAKTIKSGECFLLIRDTHRTTS